MIVFSLLLSPLVVPAADIVAFPSGEVTLHGVLYKPEGAGPFPAVVYNHGSAAGMLSKDAFEALGPTFASHGWVFFGPYRRGQGLSASAGPYIGDEIAAAEKKGGIFRSSDLGVTWEKRNDFDAQAQYYAHMVVDPKNPDRLHVMSVYLQVSDDAGKSLRGLGERWKHVDNHEIWIDPRDKNYYLVGCDGGIYESFDQGEHWKFISNLPITQFYDVAVDDAAPFYHVYGGTQDNFTLGGPARTRSVHGISNADWFVTQGGDGFHSRVDPKDPHTVYSEAQYGVLVRFDRRTGEAMGIQP